MKRKLIVGLGNPGREFRATYHNAGFLALDFLVKRWHTKGKWTRPRGKSFSYLEARRSAVVLVKPLTYMNDSGHAVLEALRFFKVSRENLIVLHDESDIQLGTARIASARGAAGHRGILSIMQALGTKEFFRIRIGIRREGLAMPAEHLVLKTMTKADNKALQLVFGEVDATIENVIKNVHF